jgi:hypothetical protein
MKRLNQSWHVYAVVGWNFKGALHFYTGLGKGGLLIQADYVIVLEGAVAPNWDKDFILFEDNDGPDGIKGKADNKVK